MSKFEVFQRQVSLGATVTLRLTRGDDITGRVTELNENHVCVDVGQRSVTIFEDILAGWEIHQGPDEIIGPASDSKPITPAPADPPPQPPKEEVDSSAKTIVPSLPADSAVLERRTRIDASYSEAVKRAGLEPVEPDFSFPDEEFPKHLVTDARREWDRARNQYQYAMKVREENRISNIVGQILGPLAELHHSSPSLRALLGSLLLKIGEKDKALEHFHIATNLSRRQPHHWYCLAYAATGTAIECYALRNYLLATQADKVPGAWLRYLRVVADYPDPSGAVRILDRCFSQPTGGPPWEMAAETLIYLFERLGASDIAEESTRDLIREETFPPEGWRDLLSRSMPEADPEIAQEDARYVAPKEPPKSVPDVPCGRIESFGNQRFGFIEAGGGETFFFRIDNVTDEGLKQALLDGAWRSKPEVEFKSVPSYGHRYSIADKIIPLQDADALIERAQQLRRESQYANAIALVRRAFATNKDYRQQAQKLEHEIKNEMQRLGIGLPKGQGPYARAKRAQLVDQDFDRAVDLYRAAIKQRDKLESAVKDLSMLLDQLERSEEAINLLESKRKGIRGKRPYDNILATLYQNHGHHKKAIALLETLAQEAKRGDRAVLLRRIVFSYFKTSRYDDAERTLNQLLDENPGDRPAERLLVGLEDARAGRYDEAIETIGELGALAEEGLELSALAHAAIDKCAYEGVEPSKVQSGALGPKEVRRLEDLAKQLGTRRPRDRAAYYLSAAAILTRDSSEEGSGRIYDYLRRHFTSMGDAAWGDKRPADVVRTFFLESLVLESGKGGNETWHTLERYLFALGDTSVATVEEKLPVRARDRIGFILKKTWPPSTEEFFTEAWRLGLLDACSQSGFVAREINHVLEADADVRALFAKLLGVPGNPAESIISSWKTACNEFSRSRKTAEVLCRTQTRHKLATASMEDLLRQLRGIDKKILSELDRRRLGDVCEVASQALQFCKVSDFEEKEQYYWIVTSRSQTLVDQIIQNPTHMSFSAFFPIAEHLKSLTEEEYAESARTSGAQLILRLLVNEYARNKRGEVKLQIEVENKQGCSPASSVHLLLGPPDSPYFEVPGSELEITGTLRGGASVVGHVKLTLTEFATQEPAFPIRIRASYRNRVGEECGTEESEWTVRLYAEDKFQEVPNKYAPYAEGGPVDDPEMFVGRDSLLDQLHGALLSGAASKCIVVFGQKRSGKSSILEHLKRRLAREPNCIPVQFSLYELGPSFNESGFYYQILSGIFRAIEDSRHERWNMDGLTLPSLEDLSDHPTARFHETMGTLSQRFRDKQTVTQARIVLLIDEFTEVYKQIRKNTIPPGFMKAWKAIVEKRYFASVLVGQDIMPDFKASFPNEFGVTEDVRVSYLSDSDGRKLIEEPVGKDRYVGKAVERVLALTAGNPYYTMMLCNRLVEYMNRTRSAVVTEADISAIERAMISGDRRLTRDKFDNLICAGDGKEDSGIDPEETIRLCAAIAKGSERGWCSRDAIEKVDKEQLDGLLTDVERRDVVEQKGNAYRLRVGLFHNWLIEQG